MRNDDLPDHIDGKHGQPGWAKLTVSSIVELYDASYWNHCGAVLYVRLLFNYESTWLLLFSSLLTFVVKVLFPGSPFPVSIQQLYLVKRMY